MTVPRFDARYKDGEYALSPSIRLDVMTQDDVADVSRVERRCFANPWPASAYRRELQNPAQNHYVVLRALPQLGAGDPHAGLPSPGDDARPEPRSVPRRSLLPIAVPRRHDDNDGARGRLVGFAGMWMAFDEAHVTTIGVDPDYRGRGLGELLLLCMFDEAVARGANWLTLEVRISNAAAQTLYRKYGFSVQGTRKRYYSDNNEDALIMWSRPLSDREFRVEIDARRAALRRRLGAHLDPTGLAPLADSVSQTAAS
jgi:ribosomal-protein-alanine N-acetyltransferase